MYRKTRRKSSPPGRFEYKCFVNCCCFLHYKYIIRYFYITLELVIQKFFQSTCNLFDVNRFCYMGVHAMLHTLLNIVGICIRRHGDYGKENILTVH